MNVTVVAGDTPDEKGNNSKTPPSKLMCPLSTNVYDVYPGVVVVPGPEGFGEVVSGTIVLSTSLNLAKYVPPMSVPFASIRPVGAFLDIVTKSFRSMCGSEILT